MITAKFYEPSGTLQPTESSKPPRETGSVIIPFYRGENQGPGPSPAQVSQLVMDRNRTHVQSSKDEGSRNQRKRDVLARGAESWREVLTGPHKLRKPGQWWRWQKTQLEPPSPLGQGCG